MRKILAAIILLCFVSSNCFATINQCVRFPTGTPVNCSDGSGSGGITNIATTAPITGGPITSTGTIGITQSTTSTNGYLSSTDWNTFNNKVSSQWTLSGSNLYSPTVDTVSVGSATNTYDIFTVNSTSNGLTISAIGTGMQDGTGGTITHIGGNTIHTFTSSGTFTPGGTGNVSVLVIGGGGAGGGAAISAGAGGGGGAGQVSTNTSYAVTNAVGVTATVGAGGTGVSAADGNSGSSSVFGTITSVGGSGGKQGGVYTGGASGNGFSGGSGSGAGAAPGGGGAGSSGNGGNNSGNTAGAGGAGTASSLSGGSVTYAGGGGGGAFSTGTGGTGTAGGGNGSNSANGSSANSNTGSGGGGSSWSVSVARTGGSGGSGEIIISYPTSQNSPGLRLYGGASQTGKLWSDGLNSNRVVLTGGTTDGFYLSSSGAPSFPTLVSNGPVYTSGGNGTLNVGSTTGSGTTYALQTSPSLITPTIGVATATTVNNVTITTPASSATLTIANGKTLTVTNTVNLNTMVDADVCTYTSSGTLINCNTAASSLGLVNSVSNSDGTLTISPTTGAVVASLASFYKYEASASAATFEGGI